MVRLVWRPPEFWGDRLLREMRQRRVDQWKAEMGWHPTPGLPDPLAEVMAREWPHG